QQVSADEWASDADDEGNRCSLFGRQQQRQASRNKWRYQTRHDDADSWNGPSDGITNKGVDEAGDASRAKWLPPKCAEICKLVQRKSRRNQASTDIYRYDRFPAYATQLRPQAGKPKYGERVFSNPLVTNDPPDRNINESAGKNGDDKRSCDTRRD